MPGPYESDPRMAAMLRTMSNKITDLEAKLNMSKIQGDVPASLPGQYPGKPIPHTEGVEIAVAANTNQSQNNITIAADGPFLAHRIHFAWRPTSGLTGLWRPLSHVEDHAGNVMVDAIDFYWEYQVSGSYRHRQNIAVPSSGLTEMGRGNGAWELYVQDVFSPTSTITIKVTPSAAPSHAGVLYVGFHGCYVLK